VIRDTLGTYTYAWWGGAALCAIAAVLSILVRRNPGGVPALASMPVEAGPPVPGEM
jgi:hypothetical protein